MTDKELLQQIQLKLQSRAARISDLERTIFLLNGRIKDLQKRIAENESTNSDDDLRDSTESSIQP